jgi:hypothetical protein
VRARQSARWRQLGSAVGALAAVVLIGAGLDSRNRWLIGAGLAAAALTWWSRPVPDPDRWFRGAAGEEATAKLLAQLPRRFIVLHDRRRPGDRGNLDHIVLGPSGIWVVDSKVRHAQLRVRRGQVWAGEHVIDVAPVVRQAAGLQAGLGVPVTAVVAVHGEGLRRRGKKVNGVRILPAPHLVRRLRRGRRLRRSQVAALASRVDHMLPPC